MVCECSDDNRELRGYTRYYDFPDGKATTEKAMVVARYGIVTGLLIATSDVLMYSHAMGFGNILARYLKHTLPLGLMGVTFAVVANTLVNVRGKDDQWNYFLGGAACGPLMARYLAPRTKHAIVLPCALALGAVAYVKKEGVLRNYTFVPDIQPHMGHIYGPRNDFTLAKDPRLEAIKICGRDTPHPKDKEPC